MAVAMLLCTPFSDTNMISDPPNWVGRGDQLLYIHHVYLDALV